MHAPVNTFVFLAMALAMVQVKGLAIPQDSTAVEARSAAVGEVNFGSVSFEDAEVLDRRDFDGFEDLEDRSLIGSAVSLAVKAARLAKGLSPSGLASAVGVAVTVITDLENGTIPGKEILDKIESFLGIHTKRDLEDRSLIGSAVGLAVKAARLAKGLSPGGLATAVGVAVNIIEDLENGTIPGKEILDKIESFLGIHTKRDLISTEDALETRDFASTAIGLAVKAARIAIGLSPLGLASKIGIAVEIIEDLENGKLPGQDILDKIEQFLGIKKRDLSAVEETQTLEARKGSVSGKALGALIAAARKLKGLSLSDLASKIGTTVSIINSIESTGLFPTDEIKKAIINFFGLGDQAA
jgi:ribosome-binding protein aMBF1 (putative translation factor)